MATHHVIHTDTGIHITDHIIGRPFTLGRGITGTMAGGSTIRIATGAVTKRTSFLELARVNSHQLFFLLSR